MRQYVLKLAQNTICSSYKTPASLRNGVHRLGDVLMCQVQHDLHKQILTLQVKLLFAEQCDCLGAWQKGGGGGWGYAGAALAMYGLLSPAELSHSWG